MKEKPPAETSEVDDRILKPLALFLSFTFTSVLLVLVVALGGHLGSDPETVRFFLSSVFQGLAAFLAIVFAALTIEFKRAVIARDHALEDLTGYLEKLGIDTRGFTDITEYKHALEDWRAKRYLSVRRAAEYLEESTKTNISAEAWNAFVRLKDTLLWWKRACRRLGRYDDEAAHVRNIPMWTVAATLPTGLTVILSGVFLACASPAASNSAVSVVAWSVPWILFMVLFSIDAVSIFLYSVLSRLAREDQAYWLNRSKMGNLIELDHALDRLTTKMEEYTGQT